MKNRARSAGRRVRLISSLVIPMAIMVAIPIAVHAAGPDAPAGPSTAVRFEAVEGSDIKRVILTEKASERLGIEIGSVDTRPVMLTQVVGGVIVNGGSGGDGASTLLARVSLSQGEWSRLEKDASATVSPLETRADRQVAARPQASTPQVDASRSLLLVGYELDQSDHGFSEGERVRVELTRTGSGIERTTVPYGAIYYDGFGEPWVYVNTAPLTFERQRVAVDFVNDGLAILGDGPAEGTAIVTVGAALLYGAEVIFKR